MPKPRVRIGRRTWRVSNMPTEGMVGHMDAVNRTINVVPGQSEFDTKDTFLHEVIHAILADAGSKAYLGGKTYEKEEAMVLPTATGLIRFFRDNPGIAKWLIRE